jgi:hypothetical protein
MGSGNLGLGDEGCLCALQLQPLLHPAVGGCSCCVWAHQDCCLLLLLLLLCREEVPYTHRKHSIMMVTHNMELSIGQQTFQQVTNLTVGTVL